MNHDQKTIDELSNDFRKRWRRQPISVEEFLTQSSLSDGSTLLAIRLIKHEIELRRSAGERCSSSEYQERFPNVDSEVLNNLFSMPAPPPVSVLKPLLPKRYQPVKQIGKGGIGSIWQVDDRDMERTLAVKVLHTKLEKDSSANRRLRREAMLTGSLQHPGIPPVFEYGSLVGGSNYFAMKLVEGETLDRALSKLSQTELLSVFRQIAEAVGFAHSKNVIHRDLKPQNVMVGAFGEVQIMDWGMARRLDCDEPAATTGHKPSMSGSKVDTVSAHCDESVSENAGSSPSHELTRVGEILGTPAYMAPEQARGESASIDARTDVFGLGAILFAMLTGKRIYDGHSAAEMISLAAKGNLDAAFLSLDQTEPDADLRDLCKDCLQPKADDRPADASVVAERIGDYQNNVQNRLRQAELDQRATLVKADEQQKRTRVISWMSGLAILLTTAGLIGVTWQWSNAAEARSLAVKRLSETRNTVDEFYTTISERGGILALNPGTQELRKELLQKAKDYYVNFVSEYYEDEEAWLEMARAYKPLIEITADLDPACDEVFELLDAQKDLLSKLINKSEANAANPEFRRLLQGAQFKLFRELTTKGAFEEALIEREKCEEFVEDWIALEDCVDARLEAAEVVYHLGFINRKLKRHGDSIVGFNKSLAMLQPLYAEHPDHRGVALNFANANNVVGAHHHWFVKREDKNLPLSNDHMELAVEINEQLVEAHPDDYELKRILASALNNLGMIQWNNVEELKDRETRTAASRASFERGVAIDRELAKNHPAIPYFRKDVAKHLNNLSTFYFMIGEIDEQMKALRESSEIINEVCNQHPQVDEFSRSGVMILDELAAVCGLGAEAEAAAKKSLQIHANRANNSGKADHKMRWALRKSIVEKTPSPKLLELTASFSETDSKNGPEIVARAMALLRNNRLDEALTIVETFKTEKDSLYKFAKGLVLAKLGQKEPSKTLLSEGQAILSKDKYKQELYYYRLLLEDELKKALADSEKQ